jgi:hypothetical protein
LLWYDKGSLGSHLNDCDHCDWRPGLGWSLVTIGMNSQVAFPGLSL